MAVTVNIDTSGAEDALANFEDLMLSDFAEPSGLFGGQRLIDRTMSGKDVNDEFFEPYARSTGKSGIPDLYDTGAMLSSIVYSPNGFTSVEIECESDIAQYHEEGTNDMPQRQFIGLSDKDVEDLVDEVFFSPLAEALA